MARLALALTILAPCSGASDPVGSPNCKSFTHCEDCSTAKSWTGDHCRWCPKDGQCHAVGSLYNTCSKSENIVDAKNCPAPTPAPPSPPPAPDTRHWCSGTRLPATLPEGNVSVFYAQAPLFSTNPSIGQALGLLNLYHTALVFQQGEAYWTLEFDLTAQNKEGNKMGDGFLPKVDGLSLTWDNEARWCLTDGLLHGKEHWTKSFDSFAHISPRMFKQLLEDFVPTLNGTADGTVLGYNLFHVIDKNSNEELVADVTCANGAIWVRDYLIKQGVPIPSDFSFAVTRMQVPVSSISEVSPKDIEPWQEVVDFYKSMLGLIDSSGTTIYAKISSVTATFPLQFVYDSNRRKYFKLVHADTTPKPQFSSAPAPWPLPSASLDVLVA